MKVTNNSQKWARRKFIATGSAIAMASVLPRQVLADSSDKTVTIQQVIDSIIKTVPGAPFANTVDTVKSGDPSAAVSGIVTASFATAEVIEKAIALKANFIIVHEPTYYNHADDTSWLQHNDVYQYKKALLDKHGIVVWRFHDYWHAHKPDGILTGVLKALGWEQFSAADKQHVLTLPSASFENIIKEVKQKLKLPKVKAIGELSWNCRRIVLLPGAWGGRRQIEALQNEKPDLLMVGELQEWETSEYIRDAQYKGERVALLVMGHAVSEEPGMQWLVQWLQPQFPGLKITHIASGSPFNWY
ncbi:MAG: Nif3-like dinuclear metal center hexameric protein [Agriterribacter sp.]